VGLGRGDCCVNCNSGVEIDLIDKEARQSWNCVMAKTITPLHVCPGSSSRFVFAPCRPRPATRLSSHSAPQRVFGGLRFPVFLFPWSGTSFVSYFVRSSGSQAASGSPSSPSARLKTSMSKDTTSARRRTPSPQRVAHRSLYLRFIKIFQLALKVRGGGKNHQPPLASYSRRP
jgi:hypothetical protein